MIIRISLFIMALGLLSYFQVRWLLSKEGAKEAVLYCLFMSVAAVVGSLLIAGVELPSYNSLLIKIFLPIGKAILGE